MNKKQNAFVTEYLKWGDQMIAYKNAYQSKADNKSLQSSANRLLNHPEVSQAIYDAEIRIRADVERQIAAKQVREFFTIEEKLNILKDIATGNIYVEQQFKGKNCTQCSIPMTSSINQRLAAIRDHSKLAGHYPHKQNGKWIIPALAEQEQQEEKNNTSPPGSNSGPCPPQADGSTREEQDEKTSNLQQNTTTPLLFLGGDIPLTSGIGVVDSRNTTTEKTSILQQPNDSELVVTEEKTSKTQQNTTTPLLSLRGTKQSHEAPIEELTTLEMSRPPASHEIISLSHSSNGLNECYAVATSVTPQALLPRNDEREERNKLRLWPLRLKQQTHP